MAVFAHLLGFLTGFIGPLVIYLIARPDQRFLRHHAAEALNFHITAVVAALIVSVLWVAGFFLSLVSGYFGLLLFLMPLLLILVVVFPVIGAIAARRGEWFHYGPAFHLFSAD